MSEERDPDLNKEAGIRMDDTRDKHWKDVDEEGYDRKNIHALR